MEELIQTIPKNTDLEPSQDYELLRKSGIEHIQELGNTIWTDYNAHDPGITLMELLSYAITDLGYRTGFQIKDIIAPKDGDTSVFENSFHKAADIFPCNQVTVTDLRKVLIDIDGIRNAWIRKSKAFETSFFVDFTNNQLLADAPTSTDVLSQEVIQLNGLYDIVIEFDRNIIKRGDTNKENEVWKTAKKEVHRLRNFCEDYFTQYGSDDTVDIVKKPDGCEEIKLFVDIDIAPDVDKEATMAEILFLIDRFLSPNVTYYSMQELFDRGKRSDQVFEGPLLTHGFIDDEELEAIQKKEVLHVSDLYNIIMDVKGVTAVRNFTIANFKNDGCTVGGGTQITPSPVDWCLDLYNTSNPTTPLDLDLVLKAESITDIEEVRFYKGDKDIPVTVDLADVLARLEVLRLSDQKRRERLENEVFDLDIPLGTFRELEDYYPVQNELPLTYGTGEAGLSDSESDERKAQAKQLKGYLMFFEQLLANYLSQLLHVRELFSWDDTIDKTYYSQVIQGIKDVEDLYVEDFVDGDGNTIDLVTTNGLEEATLQEVLNKDSETPEVFFDRRNRFLNHLIARFNELFTEYSLVMIGLGKGDEIIPDKAHFLGDYDIISHGRGKGFNIKKVDLVSEATGSGYFANVWDTENVAGYQRRVSRFLGIEKIERRFLYSGHCFSIKETDAGFHFELVIDHDGTDIVLTGVTQATDDDAFNAFEAMLTELITNGLTYPLVGSYQFEVQNNTTTLLYATSQVYATAGERTTARNYTNTTYFSIASTNNPDGNVDPTTGYIEGHDGMHVIENILLRPKDAAHDFLNVEVDPIKTSLVGEYADLDVVVQNIDQGIAPDGKQIVEEESGEPLYYIIDQGNTGDDPETVLEALEVFGCNFDNYVLKSDGPAGMEFYFYLIDTSNNILGISPYFTSVEGRNEAALKLLAYYAAINDKSVGTCEATIDPYSFRGVVVMPSWTERAKDFNYRKLAEHLIRLEAPAHVALDICWIDQAQMRELEICYRKFLIENAKGNPNEDELSADASAYTTHLNCVIDKVNNLQDAYAALYDVKIFKNEDFFRTSPPNQIGHIFADVTDPEGLDIVKAEIVGGDPLPPFIDIHGDDGTGPLSDSLYVKHGLDDSTGGYDFSVGDIALVSSDPGNPMYIGGVSPGEWTILVEVTNELDNVSCSAVTIKIIEDVEAVWTVESPSHENCYSNNDLLASVFDNNNLPTGEVVRAQLLSTFALPPGIGLNETAGFIPAYDDGTNGDSLVGHFVVTDDTALVPGTYYLGIETEDFTGGITVRYIDIIILNDPDIQIDDSNNCQHIEKYNDTGSEDIIKITEIDGVTSANLVGSIDLTFLNSIGIDIVIEGPLGNTNPQCIFIRVVDHALLKTYIENTANANAFTLILEVTTDCGNVENLQLDIEIKRDQEAVATTIPVQHMNKYNNGDKVVTVSDADGDVVDLAPQPDQTVLTDAGLGITYSGGNAYIEVVDENAFEAAASGTFTATSIDGLDGYEYTINLISTDECGGTTNLTVTLLIYKDREATYTPYFPDCTSILAYFNYSNNDNGGKPVSYETAREGTQFQGRDTSPIGGGNFAVRGQSEAAPPTEEAPVGVGAAEESAIKYPGEVSPGVVFDSNNPLVATVSDPDGPIVFAEECIDPIGQAPVGSYHRLGSETSPIPKPPTSPYDETLADWGAVLNPVTGAISIALNNRYMTGKFLENGVGLHCHKIKTTDACGGVTEHILKIEIKPDLPAVYVPESAVPKSLDAYQPEELITKPVDPNGRIISATITSGTLPPGTSFDTTTGEIRVLPAPPDDEVEAAPLTWKLGDLEGSIEKSGQEEVQQRKAQPESTPTSPGEPSSDDLVQGSWLLKVTTIDEYGGVTTDVDAPITIIGKQIGGVHVGVKDKGTFLSGLTEKYSTIFKGKTSEKGSTGSTQK